jgi:hypothetical protein
MQPQEFLMQFFTTGHLDSELAAVSQRFGDVARWVVETLPRNAERTTALRKLLEGKDAAVRTIIAARNEATAQVDAALETPAPTPTLRQVRRASTEQPVYVVEYEARVRGSQRWEAASERIAADDEAKASAIVVAEGNRNNLDVQVVSVTPLLSETT